MKLRITVAALLVSLSVLCPAPIKRAPDPGVAQPPMSMSQQELERQQAEQQRMSEVGQVPQTTEPKQAMDSGATASASDTLRTATVDAAKDVIKKASNDLEVQKNGNKPIWIFVAVMLVLGGGLVIAFRQWADKNVPMPPSKSNKQIW